jgi:predicted NAD-dependent protein-ADP-ribosyltransferase YbiA (DUF1768 family)
MISPTGEIDPLTNKYKLIPVNNKTLKQLAEIKTKEWQKEYNTLLTVGPKIMSVIIDVKNPKIVDFKGEKKSIKFKEEQKNTIGDAFIAKNIDDWGKGDVIQVFEPEQIHILGSKQDIEGFKKFIKSPLFETKTRKGVKEIFDSNSELANQVYEALGFEIPTTKLQGKQFEYGEPRFFDVVEELTSGERASLPSSILINKLLKGEYLPEIKESQIILGLSEAGIWRPNIKKIEASGENKSTLAKKIGHELLHSVTNNIILSYQNLKGTVDFTDKYYKDFIRQGYIKPVDLSKSQIEALDNLVRIRNKVISYVEQNKDKIQKQDRGFGTYDYFIRTNYTESETDLHEFISEVFTNPELINILKEIPTEGKKSNLFKDFVDAIAKILGFTNTSILEDIIAYSEEAFFTQPQITPQQKEQALQLYSQYLDTIFPDSQVKDIVYHGTGKFFERFEKAINSVKKHSIFFTTNKKSAKEHADLRTKDKGLIIAAIINALNPKKVEHINNEFIINDFSYGKNDSLIKDSGTYLGEEGSDITVNKPEQIHILGSKQDIEGFKKFVIRSFNFNSVDTLNNDIINYDQAIQNIDRLMPSWITVEQLAPMQRAMINGKITFGSFSNYVIGLNSLAPINTEYHEMFHAVFRTMLDDNQQDSIYTEGKELLRKFLGDKSFAQGRNEFRKLYSEQTKNLSNEQIDQLYIEEFLAEQFKEWIGDKSNSFIAKEFGKKKSLIQNIIDFFKNLVNFNKWFKENTDIHNLFYGIEQGKFREAEKQMNRFNDFLQVPALSQIFVETLNIEGNLIDKYLDSNLQERLLNTLTSDIIKRFDAELQLAESTNSNQGKQLIDIIEESISKMRESVDFYNPSFNELFDPTTGDVLPAYAHEVSRLNDINSVLTNPYSKTQLINDLFKRLKDYGYDRSDSTFREQEDNDDYVTGRSFDLNYENVGGFGSLSKAIRKDIALTTYQGNIADFLGFDGTNNILGNVEFTTAVNPKKVYDGLIKATANQPTLSAVLEKMNAIKNELYETKFYLDRFFNDTGLEFNSDGKLESWSDSQSARIQRVAIAFNLRHNDYIFTQLDTNEKQYNSYNANQRDLDTIQVEAWQTNYELAKVTSTTNGTWNNKITELANLTDILTKSKEIRNNKEDKLDEIISSYQTAFRKVGISLSKGYLKYIALSNETLNKTPEEIGFVNTMKDSIKTDFDYFIESIRNITGSLAGNINPYVKATDLKGAEIGNLTRLLRIAKDNAIFDETVAITTMRNAEGKTIYPYQPANFHGTALARITSEDPTQGTNGIPLEEPFRDYIENNALTTNKNFRTLVENGKVVISRIDGIKQTTLELNDKTDEVKSVFTAKTSDSVTYGAMGSREIMLQMFTLFADSRTDLRIRDAQGNLVETIPARQFIFNIMEASNTADTILLPVHNTFENNKITDTFKEFVFNEIQREFDRIQRVKNGKYLDKYEGFNNGKTQRGRAFWENEKLLSTVPQLKEALLNGVTPQELKEDLYKAIESFFLNELEENYEFLRDDLGIIKKAGKEDGLDLNLLLDKRYEGEPGLNKNEKNPFPSKNLKENIAYAYLNMYMNNTAINQLYMGDPALGLKDGIDWFKRARGNNAAGAAVTSFNEAKNVPIKMSIFAELENGLFKEPSHNKYAVGSLDGKRDKMIKLGTPEWNDFVKEYTDKRVSENIDGSTIASEIEKMIVNGGINYVDAQCYTTIEGMMMMMANLGKLTDIGWGIYNRIKQGKPIDESGEMTNYEYLLKNGLMMNSQKMVYFDGTSYIKMSVSILSKEYTSNPDGTARRGLETLHAARVQMEKNGVHLLGPPSMSKKMTKNVIPLISKSNGEDSYFDLNIINEKDQENDATQRSNITILNPAYFKLQQENPSNKTLIKDPTQMMIIVASEQIRSTPLNHPLYKTVGEAADAYNQLLADRINVGKLAPNAFLFKEDGTINTKRIYEKFRNTLEISGTSQQILDLLDLDDAKNPMYSHNLAHIVTQFEQQYNAYYNNVFSQKVAGYKTTLQSGFGHNIIFEKTTGRIIQRPEYDENPSEYANQTKYGTRELAFDQPRIVNGKEIHRYSEIILPYHFAEQFNLKPGDAIPEALAYMFGTRIPSQDKHSAMVLKVVDIMPAYYGSNAIFPAELIKLTGSDFDIDSFFIHRADHYFDKKANKFKVYGNNEDSKWYQFQSWHATNNDLVKILIDELGSLKAALKQLKLPSTEKEYNANPIKTQGEINNELLELKMILHTNPSINNTINKMPVNMDFIENGLEEIAALWGTTVKELEKSYNPTSPLGMAKALDTNKAGQTAIGAAVNNTQVYSAMSQYGLQYIYDEKETRIALNGHTIDGISAGENSKITQDLLRIGDILTTLTTSMTDNPKFGYNSKLSININSLSVLSYAVMGGGNANLALKLINLDSVSEYIKKVSTFKIRTAEEKKKKSSDIYNEIFDEIVGNIKTFNPDITKEEIEARSYTELNAEMINDALGLSSKSNNLKNSSRGEQYYITQLAALRFYTGMSSRASQLATFSNLLKLTKGISSSDNQTSFKGDDELLSALIALNIKLVRTSNGIDLVPLDPNITTGFDFITAIKKLPIVMSNLTLFNDKFINSQPLFVSRAKSSIEIKNIIESNFNLTLFKKLRTKAKTALRKNFESYLMTKAFRNKFGENLLKTYVGTTNINALLYKDIATKEGISTLNDDLEDLRIQYPELQNNHWLNQVGFQVKENAVISKYNTFNKGSNGFEALLLNDFSKLFADPRTKPYAVKTFMYLIASSGLQFKNNSFIGILPNTMFRNISLLIMDYHKILNQSSNILYKDMFGLDKVELTKEYADMFLRDSDNHEYLPRLPLKQYSTDLITKAQKIESQPVSLESTDGKTNNILIFNKDAGILTLDKINKGEINDYIDPDTGELYDGRVIDEKVINKSRSNKAVLSELFEYKKEKFKNQTGETKEINLFRFPLYIQQNKELFKLVSYTRSVSPKEAKLEPNYTLDGNWGSTARYERVTKYGDRISKFIPYGRTVIENEEVNTETLSLKYKERNNKEHAPSEEQIADDTDSNFIAPIPETKPALSKEAISLNVPQPTDNNTINIYAGTNENAELSNFAIRPFNVSLEANGEYFSGKFNTVEGAFQAAKIFYTTSGRDSMSDSLFEYFQYATGPNAKKAGRNIQNVNIQDWDEDSSSIMKNLIKQSFQQNPKALETLLATGNAILTHTQDKGKWGTEFPKLLMEVRNELRGNTFQPKDKPNPGQTALNNLNVGSDNLLSMKAKLLEDFAITNTGALLFMMTPKVKEVSKLIGKESISLNDINNFIQTTEDIEKLRQLQEIQCK